MPMLQKRIHDIDVDICPQCGGVWLDKGEMFRLRQLKPEEVKDFEIKPLEKLPARTSAPPCPICSQLLHPFKYAGGKVTLETCPNLDGLWIREQQMEEIAATQTPPPEAILAVQHMEAESHEREYRFLRAGQVLTAFSRHIVWHFIWGIPQPMSQIPTIE